MVFSETIIPPGKVLFKGFEMGPRACRTLLKDTSIFFLTENKYMARGYGHTCAYRTKKTLRLFDLSVENVKLLLKVYPLSPETKTLIRVVTGVDISIGHQKNAIREFFGTPNAKNLGVRSINRRQEHRLSYKDLDKVVFSIFSAEFLKPEKYDGYYAPKRKSAFHAGQFHSEIMINNAYQTIERAIPTRLPVASVTNIKWAIPRLFIEYSKKAKRLVRPHPMGLIVFCTGGMAIRLALQGKGAVLSKRVRRTSDFDFTFAISREASSPAALSALVSHMRQIMSSHLLGFIKFLNSNYSGLNARLRLEQVMKEAHPRVQIPGTGRRVYQVFTWKIVTESGEEIDVADSALAIYPGISRSQLDLGFSMKSGIPVQKLMYQLRDELAILSGSFLYKGIIAMRNPIKGAKKAKGLKDVNRVKNILKKEPLPVKGVVTPFLSAIKARNVTRAKRAARGVEKLLKKIR
jgi:hypothetical protein